jgi:hypothetical protein
VPSILERAFFTKTCPRCDGRGRRFTWKGGGRGADGRGISPRWDEKWEECWDCRGAGTVTLSKAEARDYWSTRIKYGSRLAAVATMNALILGMFVWCAVLVWRRENSWPLLFGLAGLWALCARVSGHYFRDDDARVRIGRRVRGPLRVASPRQRKLGAWNLALALGWVVGLTWGVIPGSWVPLTLGTLVWPVALLSAMVYGLSRS